MAEITRYEFDAKAQGMPEGEYVLYADHLAALAALRKMLFRACVELEFVRSVENCDSGLCASAEGAAIVKEGMKLLNVPDLSEETQELLEAQ